MSSDWVGFNTCGLTSVLWFVEADHKISPLPSKGSRLITSCLQTRAPRSLARPLVTGAASVKLSNLTARMSIRVCQCCSVPGWWSDLVLSLISLGLRTVDWNERREEISQDDNNINLIWISFREKIGVSYRAWPIQKHILIEIENLLYAFIVLLWLLEPWSANFSSAQNKQY